MIAKTLKNMKVDENCNLFSPSDYQTLQSTRTRIKRQIEYQDWNWQIKLGQGKVTVKRTS